MYKIPIISTLKSHPIILSHMLVSKHKTPETKSMKKFTNYKPLNPNAHLPSAQQYYDQILKPLNPNDSRSETELKELKFPSDLARIRSLVKRKRRTVRATNNNKRQCIRNTVELNSTECRKVEAVMMRKCGVILERLMKHRHGWVFNKPVDVVALRLPDYYEVVKRPMDLGTIKWKLDKGVYGSPLEFAKDVRLTFGNAMLYNRKGDDVHTMAADLRDVFDKLFVWAYGKYKVDQCQSVTIEQQMFGRPCNAESADKAKTLEGMNCKGVGRKLVFKKQKVKVNPETRKEIEIEKLRLVLEGLAVEYLDEILQIVAKRNPKMMMPDGDREIELDVHALDSETIWDLHRFALLNSKPGQKNHKAIN